MSANGNRPPPKENEETRVVYLGGDQLHNYMGQRQAIQSVLGRTGWRLLFTQDRATSRLKSSLTPICS